MSAEMCSQVCDLAGLSAEERLLLLLIANQTDSDGGGAFRPEVLAAITGLPAPAVARFLGSFEAAGLLEVEHVDPDGLTWIRFDLAVLRRLTPRKRAKRRTGNGQAESAPAPAPLLEQVKP